MCINTPLNSFRVQEYGCTFTKILSSQHKRKSDRARNMSNETINTQVSNCPFETLITVYELTSWLINPACRRCAALTFSSTFNSLSKLLCLVWCIYFLFLLLLSCFISFLSPLHSHTYKHTHYTHTSSFYLSPVYTYL